MKNREPRKTQPRKTSRSLPGRHLDILQEMLSIPTAPFAEHLVLEYVRRFCAKRKGVVTKSDKVGNLLVHVRIGSARIARPPCITAHLDHPGFVVDRKTDSNHVRAFWRGGVPKEYFVGARVRFALPEQKSWRWAKGVVEAVNTKKRDGIERVQTAVITVKELVPAGTVGMWDFPEPVIRGSRIFARGCDDIGGASAMLCAIDELSRHHKPCEAYFLFTRAEEVGFVGAIAAARAGTIPKKCFVVAMETSSERPFAKIGDGPILRVGDKASTFTHPVTAHCHQIAKDLAGSDKAFKYQRKLMDGGTCESSAYCTLGYEATGLCVALGNYHNIDARRKKLGPEYIDLNDFAGAVKWFVALARSLRRYTGRDDGMVKQMNELDQRWGRLLRQTADA